MAYCTTAVTQHMEVAMHVEPDLPVEELKRLEHEERDADGTRRLRGAFGIDHALVLKGRPPTFGPNGAHGRFLEVRETSRRPNRDPPLVFSWLRSLYCPETTPLVWPS